MDKYQIIGVNIIGKAVNAVYDASTPEAALSLCMKDHGKLRRGYQIIKNSYEKPKQSEKVNGNSNNEIIIIKLCNQISSKQKEINSAEYELLVSLLRPLIYRELNSLWRDEPSRTKEEFLHELVHIVIFEFIRRYDANKGRLYPYLRRAINKRIKKIWSREKYVNPEKSDKKRPKSADIKQYLNTVTKKPEENEEDIDIDKLKIIADEISKGVKMSRKLRKDFFGLIIKSNLHSKLTERQRLVIELYYGDRDLNEKEIKEELGVTQQTVNKNKLRAEKNIIKSLKKI